MCLAAPGGDTKRYCLAGAKKSALPPKRRILGTGMDRLRRSRPSAPESHVRAPRVRGWRGARGPKSGVPACGDGQGWAKAPWHDGCPPAPRRAVPRLCSPPASDGTELLTKTSPLFPRITLRPVSSHPWVLPPTGAAPSKTPPTPPLRCLSPTSARMGLKINPLGTWWGTCTGGDTHQCQRWRVVVVCRRPPPAPPVLPRSPSCHAH